MSGLDRDIKNMPMGMNTVVSEGGGTFSGGQHQRLMIARALVISQESSSSTKPPARSTMKPNDRNAKHGHHAGRPESVIAHRLSTIINADEFMSP